MNKTLKNQVNSSDKKFPVVGIGASAGGLASIEKLISKIPEDSGMAFVIVMHFDPSQTSHMAEVIQSKTPLPTQTINDGMKIEPNNIYVIPQKSELRLNGYKFKLSYGEKKAGKWALIDIFFRSLAENFQEEATGVVLSGMGSDGANGVGLIKAEGGLTIAEDPEASQYNSMPKHAINTGSVDLVESPQEIYVAILDFLIRRKEGNKLPSINNKNNDSENKKSQLHTYTKILQKKTGHDFSQYKQATVKRRIERRMALEGISDPTIYEDHLNQSKDECIKLLDDLFIGVTQFFRDPDIFEKLKEQVIPNLIKNKKSNSHLRIWVPGCSTGEEAYSLAALIQEACAEAGKPLKIRIFATDANEKAIKIARKASYPISSATDMPDYMLRRYFHITDNAIEPKKELREVCLFATQNLLNDPPFSNIDLISCRNTLIYFSSKAQKKVFSIFHYSLNQDGYLFLGSSETFPADYYNFEIIDKKSRFFHKTKHSKIKRNDNAYKFYNTNNQEDKKELNKDNDQIRSNIKDKVFESAVLPSVVINTDGEINYFFGNTQSFIRPSSGEANLNIFQMARSDLRFSIRSLVRQLKETEDASVLKQDVTLFNEDNDQHINARLTVQKLKLNSEKYLKFFLITFQELSTNYQPTKSDAQYPENAKEQITKLEAELEFNRSNLQVTVEELEGANEELKSMNEELQSSNEELQSTNEELETSKEELQSVNEELSTLNSELEEKVKDLFQTNNDLDNLLKVSNMGTLLLDRKFCIKRFSPMAANCFNLIKYDQGRPLMHISHNLDYDHLMDEVKEAMEELKEKSFQAKSKDGDWYDIQIRPYLSNDDTVAGIIITLQNISEKVEVQFKNKIFFETIDKNPSPIVIVNKDFKIFKSNKSYLGKVLKNTEEIEGQEPAVLKQLVKNIKKEDLIQKVKNMGVFHKSIDNIWSHEESDNKLMISIYPININTKKSHFQNNDMFFVVQIKELL